MSAAELPAGAENEFTVHVTSISDNNVAMRFKDHLKALVLRLYTVSIIARSSTYQSIRRFFRKHHYAQQQPFACIWRIDEMQIGVGVGKLLLSRESDEGKKRTPQFELAAEAVEA